MEMLLTVEQAAMRLHLRPDTVREHLARGVLRGIKRGRQWRVPESALTESAPPVQNDVQSQVDAILEEMGSGDLSRRARALTLLYEADESVRAATFAVINEKLKDIPDTADFSAWSVLDHEGIEGLEAEERELREAEARGA